MFAMLGRASALCALVWASVSFSQDAGADPAQAVWDAASEAMRTGPGEVALADRATLRVPEGYGFVPRKQAAAVMALMGNQTDEDFLGLIFPLDDAQWFATLDYIDEGHIEDDEARDWDADAMLDNLREGTKQGNAFREERGIAPIEVTGWVETPRYDEVTHRLVWSVGIKGEGQPPAADDGVNYNTYVLGREGYIALDFVTSQDVIEAQKPIAEKLLSSVAFDHGHRYTDFDASTDRIAAYGIGALVGGVALKKLGLFAVIAAFAAKFFKVIAVAVAAVFVPLYRKFFKPKQ